jgi:hypothetical protein
MLAYIILILAAIVGVLIIDKIVDCFIDRFGEDK